MKTTTLLLLISFSILVGSFYQKVSAQNYQYLGTYNSQGVPDYLVQSDVVTTAFLNTINASLPESYPVPTYNPQYIANGTETDIILQDSADVWVTFVQEGAGYKNVLGFYTYDVANPLTSAPDEEEITIVFPNVSAQGSGGGLVTGNKVQIGTFPAGTGIGWVLIANGYNGSGVGYGNWILYSNPDFNPEADSTLRFHNVLLYDDVYEKVVLGFEDIRRDNGGCDNDFNDAIFYVSSNPITAIITTNINNTSQASSTVGSGNNGGLESDGNLAATIGLRNYQREKWSLQRNQLEQMVPYTDASSATPTKAKRTGLMADCLDLSEFAPVVGLTGCDPFISTPTDLIGITNAKEVFSVDYYQGEERKGALLAMTTLEEPYDHHKTICDRLKGAVIEDIRHMPIENSTMILSTIRQTDGSIEYVTSFALLQPESGQLSLENQWIGEQYSEAPIYYNFQIWGASPAYTQKLAEEVILLAKGVATLEVQTELAPIPAVFVRHGNYKDGKLQLEIRNNAHAKEAVLIGNMAPSETSDRSDIELRIELSGAQQEMVSVETGHFFDFGFSLGNDADAQIDILYSADGPWGIDYVAATAELERFEVLPHDGWIVPTSSADVYLLERSVQVSGAVKDYFSLYKTFKAGGASVNLTAYNHLEFTASGIGTLEIIIGQSTIDNWGEQYRHQIVLTPEETAYSIPFSAMTSSLEEPLNPTHAFGIVLNSHGNGQTSEPFDYTVQDVVFTKKEEVAKEVAVELEGLEVYPNPVTENAMIQFSSTGSGLAQMELLDNLGTLHQKSQWPVEAGTQSFQFDKGALKPGLYHCVVHLPQKTITGRIIVQ